jgi:DNA-binding response OmpR family regulator
VSSILIIDDETMHAEAIGRYLERRGHVCAVAMSAEAARESVRTRHPDLVMLDMRLGEDDGSSCASCVSSTSRCPSS